MKEHPTMFCGRNFSFVRGKKTYIMGILNLTPDSFSDGGIYFDPGAAIARAEALWRQGADMLDVGAMSTRPNSEPVPPREEMARLACLQEICRRVPIPVSVDTYRPEVAFFALENGAAVINDVCGHFQPEMAALVKEAGCGYIVMHWPGERAEQNGHYPDGVVRDVDTFFSQILEKLTDAGVRKEQICLDPGFGFAKNAEQNVQLLKALDALRRDDVFYLTALSRKRFLGALTGVEKPEERDLATAAASVIAIQKGADMLRVHNVAQCAQAAKIADAIYRCESEE